MPFREMTITFDDINCLTGLAVTELLVLLGGYAEERSHEIIARAFELSEAVASLVYQSQMEPH